MKSFTLKCSINVNEKNEYLFYYFQFPFISNIDFLENPYCKTLDHIILI